MVAELLDGRAWSDLDNLEGAIFDRLQDEGFLRTQRGIVVWTPIDAITRQRTKDFYCRKASSAEGQRASCPEDGGDGDALAIPPSAGDFQQNAKHMDPPTQDSDQTGSVQRVP
jgi:hypothetical protein